MEFQCNAACRLAPIVAVRIHPHPEVENILAEHLHPVQSALYRQLHLLCLHVAAAVADLHRLVDLQLFRHRACRFAAVALNHPVQIHQIQQIVRPLAAHKVIRINQPLHQLQIRQLLLIVPERNKRHAPPAMLFCFCFLSVQKRRHRPVSAAFLLQKISVAVLRKIGHVLRRPPFHAPLCFLSARVQNLDVIITNHLAQLLLIFLIVNCNNFLRRHNAVAKIPLSVIINVQVFHPLVRRPRQPALQHPVKVLICQLRQHFLKRPVSVSYADGRLSPHEVRRFLRHQCVMKRVYAMVVASVRVKKHPHFLLPVFLCLGNRASAEVPL